MSNGLCARCGQKDGFLVDSAALSRETDAANEATIAPNRTSVSPSETPRTIGDYELIEEIARGGMGVVYKARHSKLNRIAAIKMVLGGRFSSGQDLQRFQIEAEAAAKLDHPGIVPVFDIGDQDGQPFFAMKYIAGGSLDEKMDEYRANPRQAVEMLANVSRAVHHAHQRGIMHRDLKPANILIDETGQPLITDLGLAKSTGGDSNLTNTGAVLGTPSYMSPEQASGKASITTASDLFSIGAIMYELLAGRPPHKGASTLETMMSVINNTPEPPRKLNNEVDSDLELICLKCIEREPEQRYDSAAALANDLECWLEGQSISIKAPSLFRLLSRWTKQNQRLIYVMFAFMIGLAFCFPFMANFFGASSDLSSVYERFPNEDRPWIYSLQIPEWVSGVSALILIFVLWPAIGLLNILVSRPKSLRNALGVGFLTSAFCALIVLGGMGWLVLVVSTGRYVDDYVRILGNAVWVSEEMTREEAVEAANELYPGLDAVPANERADVLADRIASEQIPYGLSVIARMLMVGVTVVVPVIYGTSIAYMLAQRKLPFWLMIIRYGLAWISGSFSLVFVVGYSLGGVSFSSDVSPWLVAFLLVNCLIAYLSLRRWKKPEPELSAV